MIKQKVWKNKSNNQLCVTVPSSSGMKEGDIVIVERDKIKTIAYSFVVADLFHFGHLQLLQKAALLGDMHICGVLTDEGAETYRSRPITNFMERKAIVASLNCVDRVMAQNSQDPTDNLKKIHEEFPWAKIILIHGSDWENVPGEEYIKEIGGEVVRPPYYDRLSTTSIINSLKQLYTDHRSFEKQFFKLKNSISLSINKQKNVISTKANTLMTLRPIVKKSRIEDIFTFTVAEWESDRKAIIDKIREKFKPKKIVIRSSAINEDTFDNSMAGYFHSELDVMTDDTSIEQAVKKVIGSYLDKGSDSRENQVLVQEQTKKIAFSGVIFTRSLERNSPYYVINYDDSTSRTDMVTKGMENKTLYLARFCSEEEYPAKFRNVISAVKEIEGIIQDLSLDIEFAVDTEGSVVIYQVRPMAADSCFSYDHEPEVKETVEGLKLRFIQLSGRKEGLAGSRTFFCDMPDWNPAEIIGNNPNYLDYSLYSYLIMDSAWHKARTSQGYTTVNEKLMVLFGNKPYVDVRNSFNSFVPASVSSALREKLVSYYLDKLLKNPHLQDKVEFEIAFTCYDLLFDKKSIELMEYGFSKREVAELKEALVNLTNNLVANHERDIAKDNEDIERLLESRREILAKKAEDPKELIKKAHQLLSDCRELGTIQFSRLARLAFIGKIILKSIVDEGIISEKEYHNFLNSVSTVATNLSDDFTSMMKGELGRDEFISRYGHLRPGTYDITAPRYDSNPELIDSTDCIGGLLPTKPNFEASQKMHAKISSELARHGLNFDSEILFSFIRRSLIEREKAKFEFSKNLSDSLELISQAGSSLGFLREDMANLDYHSLMLLLTGDEDGVKDIWQNLIKSRKEKRALNSLILLPPVIFSDKDFFVFSSYQSRPNFITNKKIKAKALTIPKLEKLNNLKGKIALIESADPGYDWIFTKKISGLVTKYGGVASHMSIRCAEFGIPAAIGCGELYESLKNADTISLDCGLKKITCGGKCY